MEKIKVLFVVSEFWQAGTQRFTYELDRAIDKTIFEIYILSILPLQSSTRFKDHYYQKHLDLGTKIIFLNEIKKERRPTIVQRIKRKLFSIKLPDLNKEYIDFYDQFACISVMGEYNYKEISSYLKDENKRKLVIQIQNSRFQHPELYLHFDKNEKYHFVSSFGLDQIKWELEEFQNYSHTYYNLNLKFENKKFKSNYIKNDKPKIGIFTRLTYTKPLDPFIYTFKSVTNIFSNAELHLFGSGNPIEEGVMRFVNQLQLEENVFFRGHQENIIETALREELDLVWLHGYHGIPGGWAGFDIATAKIPQLFWNFGASPGTIFRPFFPMFNDTQAFANASILLLTNPDKSQKIANEQFEYINEHYNIENNIHVMEELFQKIFANEY